jgi:hypothetical protein
VRTDGDFEDREGHQAPFTLQEEENVQRSTFNVQHPKKGATDRRGRLLKLFDLRDEGIEVGPLVGGEFGVKQFSIGADFEGAAAGWYQRERRNPIAEFEYLSRQTDGFRRVISNAAILDPDFSFHCSLLSISEVNGMGARVKV